MKAMKPTQPNPLNRLTPFEREILAGLPVEPNGHSLHELAADYLGQRSPAALSRMKDALARIGAALGGLAIRYRRQPDAYGRADVAYYGVRRRDRASVQRFFRAPMGLPVEP